MENMIKFIGCAVFGCLVAFLLGKVEAFNQVVARVPVSVGREYVSQVAPLHAGAFLFTLAMMIGAFVFLATLIKVTK